MEGQLVLILEVLARSWHDMNIIDLADFGE